MTTLRDTVAALGPDLSPEMMRGTQAFLAERFGGMSPETRIARDLAYGPDERHRLDVFRQEGASGAPVLVFVHGGGFVMGDKRMAGALPFYDNVGDFAARNGMVGVTVTYRLAPAHGWPAGAEDIAAIVRWLHANVAAHGGDPARIFLIGQSAGAVHVASYVAHAAHHAAPGGGIAGAMLISTLHDVAAAHANQFHRAYYGEDPAAYPAASTTQGLIESAVPLLLSVSEFDPADFQKQAASFVAAHAAAKAGYPRMHYLAGHNHLSPVLAIGTPDDILGPIVKNFVAES